MKVEREFDAPLQRVWDAWTKAEILDKWWAPKPWKANTQSMDFRIGGAWLYYMEGPEGERHYCRADFSAIVPQTSINWVDAFCDEKGNILTDMPRTDWRNQFIPHGAATKIVIELIFANEADLEKYIEMGFKEGFAAAHKNLDELLAA